MALSSRSATKQKLAQTIAVPSCRQHHWRVRYTQHVDSNSVLPRQQRYGRVVVAPVASLQSSGLEATSVASTSAYTGRNVVVAIDNSRDSYMAVQWTLQHLYRQGDILHLVHVIPDEKVVVPNMPIRAPFATDSYDEMQETMNSYVQQFIDSNFMPLAAEHSAECKVALVKPRNTSVGQAICNKSEELKAAVVVVSAHRKSAVAELVFGSVSKHVVTHCKQPTLVFHSQTMAVQSA